MYKNIIFSNDGQLLVTKSTDDTLWIWDAYQGVFLRGVNKNSLKKIFSVPRNILFLDSNKLISLSLTRIRSWDISTGLEIYCKHIFFSGAMKALFSPNGEQIVIWDWGDKVARIIDTSTINYITDLKGHKEEITSLAFSQSSKYIVSGSKDKTIRIWDSRNGTQLACLVGHQSIVTWIAFSKDEKYIVSSSVDKTIRIWSTDSFTQIQCFSIENLGIWRRCWHNGKIESEIYAVGKVAFDYENKYVLAQSISIGQDIETSTVKIWDITQGECIHTFHGKTELPSMPTKKPWLAFLSNHEIEIMSYSTGAVIARFPVSIEEIAAHPSGSIWAGKSSDGLFYHFTVHLDNECLRNCHVRCYNQDAPVPVPVPLPN